MKKEEKQICYVIETYTDEEKTLWQGITYPYGDEREANYQRSRLNIHLTKLVRTIYLDADGNIISEIPARKEKTDA